MDSASALAASSSLLETDSDSLCSNSLRFVSAEFSFSRVSVRVASSRFALSARVSASVLGTETESFPSRSAILDCSSRLVVSSSVFGTELDSLPSSSSVLAEDLETCCS